MKLGQKFAGPLIGLAVTALMVLLRVVDPTALSALRGSGFDTMQRLWPRSASPPQPIRVIDIDEASLKQLGQWPWPRTKIAKLVDELHELGAAAIVFDIVFPEPDRMSPASLLQDPALAQSLNLNAQSLSALPDNDDVLAKAFTGRPVVNAFASGPGDFTIGPKAKAGFAVSGLAAIDAPPRIGRITQNLKKLDDPAQGLGSINIDLASQQGIARQIPLLWSDGTKFYPSLALEALRVAQGASTYVVNASNSTENAIESIRVGDFEIPTSEQGTFSVYYRRDTPELYVSAARMISGTERETLRPLINGNIVLIGTSAVGLVDIRTSTLGEAIPGVSVHAQALEQIMSGNFLFRPEWAAAGEMLAVVALGLLISLFTTLLRPLPLLVSVMLVAAAFVQTVVIAFRNHGLLLDLTFPVLAVATIFLSTIAFRLLVTDREGRQIRRVFGQYVAPAVLAEIEKNPKSLKLGGETRDVTVMFVDIQNFTPLGEKLSPEQLVHIVNGVLSTCSRAILENGGTIDKYIGDAVMAFWNAPIAKADHQYHAALAALAMITKLETFNALDDTKSVLEPKGLWPISVRVGLASGSAIVGNMGSLERFDYSVLGETVNIASRAEGTCKQIGTNILIAGQIAYRTTNLALLSVGAVEMKGKSVRIPTHAVLGDEAFCSSQQFIELQSDFRAITGAPKMPTPQAANKLAERHPAHAQLFRKLPARAADFSKN